MRPTSATFLALTILTGGALGHGTHENDWYNYESEHEKVDCTSTFCSMKISRDLEKRWHVHTPSDYNPGDDMCTKCELTVQLIYNGYTWLGYGVSPDGDMVGSTVVIGRPSEEEPTLYELEGKMKMRVRPITGFNLQNSYIKYDAENAQTIMEFTTTFNTFGVTEEDDEYRVGISLKNPTYFIYAHGDEGNVELNYHGGNNKGSYRMENLFEGDETDGDNDDDEDDVNAMTMIQSKSTKNAWRAHGILAFLAWGICAPLAISAAVLRDLDLAPLWNKLPCCKVVEEKYLFKNFLAKFWLYTHAGLNSLNYVFTVVAFSIAVNTSSREMRPHFDHAHPRIGLTIFILLSFQLLGGFLRPSKENKTSLRTTWENIHHLLGVTLFVMGVNQLYTGLSMYRDRYDGVSSVLYMVLGLLVFVWASIILGGSFYKLMLFIKGGQKETKIEDTEGDGKTNGQDPTKESMDDLKFEEEEVVSGIESSASEDVENEVI